MWSLALAALAALAVAVHCQCPDYVEPLNKTMRRLEFDGSLSWRDIDSACNEQFPGRFEMLGRDFLHLSEADRALCGGQVVPLGLRKEGLGPIVWRETKDLGIEEVHSTYLAARMRGDETADYRVGALDLATNQWRLVDDDTSFTCAICQRAWGGKLQELRVNPPSRPEPFARAFTFRIVKAGHDNVTVDEAIRRLVEHLNQTQGIKVEIEKLASDPGVHNGAFLRMKTSMWLKAADVSPALTGSYGIEYWQDMDLCPDTRLDELDWQEKWAGFVDAVTLPDFHVAIRRCSWRMRPDGDWDAVWDDDVTYWIDRSAECRTQAAGSIVRRLEDFAARPAPGRLELEELAKITAEVHKLKLPQYRFYSLKQHLSNAITTALSALVDKYTASNASSACYDNACAFLTAMHQDTDAPDSVTYPRWDARPMFLNSKQVDAGQQTPGISLQLPSAMTSAGRVALSTVRSGGPGTTNLSLFQPCPRSFEVDHGVSFHIATPGPVEARRVEGRLPVATFRVNNTRLDYGGRHLTVWSLGGSEESTLPCPWVSSEGGIDTYWCNYFVSGPRNFTTGAFLAVSGRYARLNEYTDGIHRVFRGYTAIQIYEPALERVASLTDYVVEEHFKFNRRSLDKIPNILDQILSHVLLSDSVFTVSQDHVKVLVSDLTASDPVVGFSLGRLAGAGPVQTVTAGKRNVSSESAVDLVLGASLEQHCDQLAVMAVSDFSDIYPDGSLGAFITSKLMVVHLVVTSRSGSDVCSRILYFDIQISGEIGDEDNVVEEYMNEVNDEGLNNIDHESDFNQIRGVTYKTEHLQYSRRFLVATWSEAASDWSVSTCARLRSTRASKQVFRCEHLAFAGNEFRGRFLIFESSRFADAIGEMLLGILIAAGVLSGASLASIVVTAVALVNWRKHLVHKILLQMTLALSGNLALGFVSSLVSVDTAGVACVGIGALRHFFYLAMFAWMLVMSGLQLWRLLSVLGARTTSRLVLKVSCPAWGVPAVAVGALVLFNTDVYLSDAADRGFCYPEGAAFTWAVQVPAAAVLVLNALIFAAILARLYNWRGWGKSQSLRRHQNERVFQLRRLKAVFFKFCLFGISWMFHLLAEQGVFQEKYLYEYLFLMTASVHVFSLSCIFVFFEQETRAEWLKVGTSVRDSFFTRIASIRESFSKWLIRVWTAQSHLCRF